MPHVHDREDHVEGVANHRLRILDMYNTHSLDFLWRKETKLNLLYRAQGRARVRKSEIRHNGGCVVEMVGDGEVAGSKILKPQ